MISVCFHHSHKKLKDSLEIRVVLLIVLLELEMPGVAVQSIHQKKMATFAGNCSVQNDFEAVLASFCCYDHGAKASEEVQKMATD